MNEALLIAILCVSAASLIFAILAFLRSGKKKGEAEALQMAMSQTRSEINAATANSIGSLAGLLTDNQKQVFSVQDKRLEELAKLLSESMTSLRTSLDSRFNQLREEVDKNLKDVRSTVDEKLQTTLEKRLSQSFKEVSERLEQVYKGLGEMQNLATGVGDLKKALSNVKTRGILGEIQLGAILSEIMSPEQYEENVATIPNSKNRVEFAVKMPGNDEGAVYLPIDSKFPLDSYTKLTDAYETGDSEAIRLAKNELTAKIKTFAKDIRDKYVSAPYTTDFGIMFLPTEGLYAEVLRLGLVETLQKEYKVNIAGPTTMAALLNSLRMGFKTLAIQKRSGEVWNILSAVKTEFETFENALKMTQTRIDQANRELDRLVTTRTRAINRKLREVSTLPSDTDARELIGADYSEDSQD